MIVTGSQVLLARLMEHATVRGLLDTSSGPPSVLLDSDVLVVRCGDRVLKVHRSDADPALLRARLDLAAGLAARGVMITPQIAGLEWVCGRAVTVWPLGEPVAPENPDAAPWAELGELAARLHRAFPEDRLPGLPRSGAAGAVVRALVRLEALSRVPAVPAGGSRDVSAQDPVVRSEAEVRLHRSISAVRRAAAELPSWATGKSEPPGRRAALTHGDLHLGQLVRIAGSWRLLDPDDLGRGDPAWDLARPAAWYAVGLLHPDDWDRFLGAYRDAGGPAVPPRGDPWPALEPLARVLTIQLAATGVAAAVRQERSLDEYEAALVTACERMPAPKTHVTASFRGTPE